MRGGDSQRYRLTQYAYPYAPGGAVTYLKPGQSVFGTETRGGWYRADGLRRTLVAHGLAPTVAEATGGSSSANLALVAGFGIPGALAALGAAGFSRAGGAARPARCQTRERKRDKRSTALVDATEE